MNTKIIIVFCTFLLMVSYAEAQNSKAFFDSIIKNEDNQEKAPIALPYVEPADVIWCKTVWRELILRGKNELTALLSDGTAGWADVFDRRHDAGDREIF